MVMEMTLEEAIKHAKDIAKDINACTDCRMEHKQLAGWLEELLMYRKMDKQGRLLRLPCDIGTRVYKPYIAVCEGEPWLYAPNIDVHYIKLEDLPVMGEKVFLKRSEAERKLAKMVAANKVKLKEIGKL